jgi:hypothetical protein
MSTRSLTLIYDDKGAELLNIYRHSDGYPSGHGQELARFLSGFQIVNGLRYEGGKIANGIGCLAAQLVAHLKDEPGQIYIYPIGKRNVWEDYVYEIRPTGSGIRMICRRPEGKVLFDGSPERFDADKIENQEQEDAAS